MTDILRNAVTEEELFKLALIPRMLYCPPVSFSTANKKAGVSPPHKCRNY